MWRYLIGAVALVCASAASAAGVLKGEITDSSGSLTFDTSTIGGSLISNQYVTVRFSAPLDSLSLLVELSNGTTEPLTQIGDLAYRGFYNTPDGVGGFIPANDLKLDYTYSGQSPISYSVRFMPGLPEPATWMTMILGFGMIGFAMRRRASYSGHMVPRPA